MVCCAVQVEKLSALLGVVGTEYTCETAGYFWLLHVLSRCAVGQRVQPFVAAEAVSVHTWGVAQ